MSMMERNLKKICRKCGKIEKDNQWYELTEIFKNTSPEMISLIVIDMRAILVTCPECKKNKILITS